MPSVLPAGRSAAAKLCSCVRLPLLRRLGCPLRSAKQLSGAIPRGCGHGTARLPAWRQEPQEARVKVRAQGKHQGSSQEVALLGRLAGGAAAVARADTARPARQRAHLCARREGVWVGGRQERVPVAASQHRPVQSWRGKHYNIKCIPNSGCEARWLSAIALVLSRIAMAEPLDGWVVCVCSRRIYKW